MQFSFLDLQVICGSAGLSWAKCQSQVCFPSVLPVSHSRTEIDKAVSEYLGMLFHDGSQARKSVIQSSQTHLKPLFKN